MVQNILIKVLAFYQQLIHYIKNMNIYLKRIIKTVVLGVH